MSSVESSFERVLCIARTTAMLCPRRPASCRVRLRVPASRRPSHRLISDEHLASAVLRARGARSKLNRARVRLSFRVSATVIDAPAVYTDGPGRDRRRIRDTEGAIAKAYRLSNVSDLAIAATCAISRSLPRMAAHEADPELRGPLRFQGDAGLPSFHARMMDPHFVPGDPNSAARKVCAKSLS